VLGQPYRIADGGTMSDDTDLISPKSRPVPADRVNNLKS
jgi:hypothetical protein